MDVKASTSAKGKAAAESLRQQAKMEEKKVERQKGSDLAKGKDRFEERSKRSDGKSAGTKQKA